MLNSLIIPKVIQNIFFGKSTQKIFSEESIDIFKKKSALTNSKIRVIWENDSFNISIYDFSSLNAFSTTFNAICVSETNGFYIQGKFEYDFMAKFVTVISLIFFVVISYLNMEFIFGTIMLYIFIQVEGLMLLIIDSIFNTHRERIINSYLQHK